MANLLIYKKNDDIYTRACRVYFVVVTRAYKVLRVYEKSGATYV
jgi:hypothetical protein